MALSQLRHLVNQSGCRTELACAQLLQRYAKALLPSMVMTVIYVDSELISETGRVDLVVIAAEVRPDGQERRVAYLWELKAPQAFLFQIQYLRQLRKAEGGRRHMNATQAGDLVENLGE